MYFVGYDNQLYDDGRGTETAPAYGIGAFGERYALDPAQEASLTERYWRERQSRVPLGDAVARMTKAVGIEPCSPCEARQKALNRWGDKLAWWAR